MLVRCIRASCVSNNSCKDLIYSTACFKVSTLLIFLALAAPGMCWRSVAKPLFTCLTRFLSRAFRRATVTGTGDTTYPTPLKLMRRLHFTGSGLGSANFLLSPVLGGVNVAGEAEVVITVTFLDTVTPLCGDGRIGTRRCVVATDILVEYTCSKRGGRLLTTLKAAAPICNLVY